jgi:hypothetical protein
MESHGRRERPSIFSAGFELRHSYRICGRVGCYSHLVPPSTLKKQCNGYEPGGTLTVFAGGEPLPVIGRPRLR